MYIQLFPYYCVMFIIFIEFHDLFLLPMYMYWYPNIEYMVTEHNSISEEQKERNRNIPRKSVRKNNYSGRWSDEYRYRDFDKRGHRNLHAEKYQPHERKTWAVGGTGIVTACVRGMQRSDALLEREELDLAFEVSSFQLYNYIPGWDLNPRH